MRGSVFIAVSLDGFIARLDGGIDWLDRVQLDGEDYGFKNFFDSVDVLVMGRNTWEKALSFPEWPYGGKRVVVLTNRPAVPLHGEAFYAGDVAALVLDGHAYLDGGNVIRQFLAAKLVEEMTISIVPILLGDGLPLFGKGTTENPLTLKSSRSWSQSGLVQLRYAL